MKREFIYILVLIAVMLSGLFYKSFFLSGTIENTRQAFDESAELTAKFNRDSIVQDNAKDVRIIFERNKRDDRSYGEIIADLLSTTENMLRESEIQYEGNDISQDADEMRSNPDGITSFFINADFRTNYINLRNLIEHIEKSDEVINIKNLEIARSRVAPDDRTKKILEDRGLEYDEYNVTSNLIVKLRLEFVKFL